MIASKGILESNELYLVADLGLTCSGDLVTSLKLIDVAARSGVHAVKFQMLVADELLGDKEVTYSYPTILEGQKTERMLDMFRKLEMTDDEWKEIKEKCDNLAIDLIVTCHVQSAVSRVNKLGLKYNKICTWSLDHYHMIKALANNGKPLIVDTGTIDFEELIDLKEFYRKAGGGDLIIFYDFHTDDVTEMNFSAIGELISKGFKVGYTPQGRKDWLDYMAIGFGASILEKRLTLSREQPFNGHWKAHEPDEFKNWVTNVTECFKSKGSKMLLPTTNDLEMSKWAYKSARLAKSVKKGDLISEDSFVFQRPRIGISSKNIIKNFVGRKFETSFKKGAPFKG